MLFVFAYTLTLGSWGLDRIAAGDYVKGLS